MIGVDMRWQKENRRGNWRMKLRRICMSKVEGEGTIDAKRKTTKTIDKSTFFSKTNHNP